MTKRHKWQGCHHATFVFCTDDYTLVHENGCIETESDILSMGSVLDVNLHNG